MDIFPNREEKGLLTDTLTNPHKEGRRCSLERRPYLPTARSEKTWHRLTLKWATRKNDGTGPRRSKQLTELGRSMPDEMPEYLTKRRGRKAYSHKMANLYQEEGKVDLKGWFGLIFRKKLAQLERPTICEDISDWLRRALSPRQGSSEVNETKLWKCNRQIVG